MELNLVRLGQLTLAVSNFDARPMSYLDGGTRWGYEPEVARVVCAQLQLEPVWLNLPMADFYQALQARYCDAIWFNQAVTDERRACANFTRPYGYFDEAVLVRANTSICSPRDLSGLRVGGLAASTNLRVAESFAGARLIPFAGSDRVLPEMLDALRRGSIDALIDDELVLIAAAEADSSLKIAFTLPTHMPFAVAVRPGEVELLHTLNQALNKLLSQGTLAQIWSRWIPQKSFPL